MLIKTFSKEIVAQAFSRYVNHFTEGNTAAFARILQIPKNKVWMWQMGKLLPELNLILKICFTLQVSVLDFLTQETAEENLIQIPVMPQIQAENNHKSKLKVKLEVYNSV